MVLPGQHRYSRRRYGYRALSTRRIFSRTSAKSQASQIYALRRSMQAIAAACRPETKVAIGTPDTFTMTNSSVGDTYKVHELFLPSTGVQDFGRLGDAINVKNGQFAISLEYFNNSATGYHAGESAGCPIRFLVLCDKVPSQAAPALSDILSESGMTGASYSLRAISPLKRGVTEDIRVLYDRVINVTTTSNQKNFQINLHNIGEIRWDKDGNSKHVWLFVIPSGLHFDTDFTETIQYSLVSKCAFTDA